MSYRSALQRLFAFLRERWMSGGPSRHYGRESLGYALGSTGETVYDRTLRFRTLTLPESDQPAPDDTSTTPAGFKIRISKLRQGRKDAGTLVEHRYGGRGYQIPGFKRESNLFTFIAYDEGQLVGTVGLRMDSKKGLMADDLYPGELAELRAHGWRLCEFTRLAVDRGAASKPVLAGLFHTAYLYAAVIRGSTHAVIEVNPRHVNFYGRALAFEVIGEERVSNRVNAPAVLLGVAFATIAEGLAKYAGQMDAPGAGRSLFPYGFAPDEEAGVLHRLRELVATR